MKYFLEIVKRKHKCFKCPTELVPGNIRFSFENGYRGSHLIYRNLCIPCGLIDVKREIEETNNMLEELTKCNINHKIRTLYFPGLVSIKEYDDCFEIKPFKQKRIAIPKVVMAEVIYTLHTHSVNKLYTQAELEDEFARRVANKI